MNSSTTSTAGTGQPQWTTSAAAFEFVRELATTLSAGEVELPSFPEVTARVQRALARQDVALERLVRIVGSEPLLASRVVTLANSVLMNPGGAPVSELRSAVTRLGFDNLRTVAIAFALRQVQRAQEFQGIQKPLTALWQRSVHMAAMCCVIARQGGQVNPDTALLAGLVHGVGRIYILTRASRHAALCADQQSYQAVVRDWHGNIARALLESWHFPEEIVLAVQSHADSGREGRTASLADVLAVADVCVSFREHPEELSLCLQGSRPLAALGLDLGGCGALLQQFVAEMKSLMSALRD